MKQSLFSDIYELFYSTINLVLKTQNKIISFKLNEKITDRQPSKKSIKRNINSKQSYTDLQNLSSSMVLQNLYSIF